MLALCLSLLFSLQNSFRTRAALQAEILALRHQLLVLQRSRRQRRLRLRIWDRALWVCLLRLWPGRRSALLMVKPETVIAWHRKGFRLYWTWKSRILRGRPRVPNEVRELIRHMSLANPRWGEPRIHEELLKLGIEVSQATVAKYMVRHRKPPSQTWRTFLRNHTATFRVLFVFVILSHDRWRPLHFGVTPHPTAEWTAQQLLEAFPWDSAPRSLLSDRDGSYVPSPKNAFSPRPACIPGRVSGLGWKRIPIVLLQRMVVNRKSKSVLELEQGQTERFAAIEHLLVLWA
jgi:putative transposase